jgi:predicted RNA methylase
MATWTDLRNHTTDLRNHTQQANNTERHRSGLRQLFGEDWERWKWTPQHLTYTTPRYIADKVAETALQNYPCDSVLQTSLWDMFAGLGSDTVHFAKVGYMVLATEVVPSVAKLLEQNVNQSNVCTNAIVRCVDCFDVINEWNGDIVYFDPPWGPNYSQDEDYDFNLVKLPNGKSVMDIFSQVYAKCQCIIIKAPIRCKTFEEMNLSISKCLLFKKHRLKYYFIKPTPNNQTNRSEQRNDEERHKALDENIDH